MRADAAAFGRLSRLLQKRGVAAYATTAGFVGIATIVSYAAASLVPTASLPLIYLLAVVISAQRYGLRPAIFASLMSILAWDYFFTEPVFSLAMSNQRDLFALIVFMTVSILVGTTTAHIQTQNNQLLQLAENKARLFAFSEELATAKSIEDIIAFSISYISTMLGREVVVILERSGEDGARRIFPAGNGLLEGEAWSSAALSAEIHISELEAATVRRPFSYIPLNAFRGRIGAIRVSNHLDAPIIGDEKQQLLAIAHHMAVAIERIWLNRESEASNLAAETERVRNSLLMSVSHDLRTPLTTIMGSLSTLELLDDAAGRDDRRELTMLALSEAQRLDRFIGNLLDMAKLQAGGIEAQLRPVAIADVLESVLQRAQPLLQDHKIALHISDQMPEAFANFDLLEQAIFNVVDNAAKYSSPQTEIVICAAVKKSSIVVRIIDHGSGIPEQFRPNIFQKFARASLGDTKPPGTGLGLVIAKGFLEAMGGTIETANRPDAAGAIFTIKIRAFAAMRNTPHA